MSRVVGRGWATVELERAERELRDSPGSDRPDAFEDAPRSAVLGARCRRATAPDGWIVVLEPDTEGRLAGYLARHGEGWAATWEAGDTSEAAEPGLASADPGPLGAERLLETSADGRFRLIVARDTIDR